MKNWRKKRRSRKSKTAIQEEYQFSTKNSWKVYRDTQTKVLFVKYCMNESCFILENSQSISPALCVSRPLLWSYQKQTYTPPTKETENPMLCLFYFILLFFGCASMSLFDACALACTTLISHYYYVNGAQLRCIAFRFSRNPHPSQAVTNGYSHLFFFCIF